MDKRWFIIFCIQLVFLSMTHMVNDALSYYGLFFVLSGLPVYFIAIHFPLGPGMFLCFIIGLFSDTTTLQFGALGMIYSSACAMIAILHPYINVEKGHNQLLAIQLTNTFILLASHLVFNPSMGTLGSLFLTLFASQLVLILISTWFVELQLRTLLLFGVSQETQEAP